MKYEHRTNERRGKKREKSKPQKKFEADLREEEVRCRAFFSKMPGSSLGGGAEGGRTKEEKKRNKSSISQVNCANRIKLFSFEHCEHANRLHSFCSPGGSAARLTRAPCLPHFTNPMNDYHLSLFDCDWFCHVMCTAHTHTRHIRTNSTMCRCVAHIEWFFPVLNYTQIESQDIV